MQKVKKLISSILGVFMMFATLPKASAEVEMWTFNDGTRVSKFNYTDLDYMIAFYEKLAQENEKRLLTKSQNIAVKAAGIGFGLCLLVGSGVMAYCCATSDTNDLLKKAAAGALGISGVSSIVASFYPEFVAHEVEKTNTSGIAQEEFECSVHLLGVRDICDLLKNTKQNLEELKSKGFKNGISYKDLKEYPHYILVDRPKSVDESPDLNTWKSMLYSEHMVRTDVDFKLREIFANLKYLEKLKVLAKEKIVRLDSDKGRICYSNYEKDK